MQNSIIFISAKGSSDLLKKIQNEKKVLEDVFGDLAEPTTNGSFMKKGPTRRLRNSTNGVRQSMMQFKNQIFS